MGRKVKLSDENVHFLRTHSGEKTMKEWAAYFDCSALTIFKAIHKQGVYGYELKETMDGGVNQ
jgi:hypothetical protein